jgi:hypothetical protein
VRNVLEEELVDDVGFVLGRLVVSALDHCRELGGAFGIREFGVEPVVHAFAEDGLEGGEVGMGANDGT